MDSSRSVEGLATVNAIRISLDRTFNAVATEELLALSTFLRLVNDHQTDHALEVVGVRSLYPVGVYLLSLGRCRSHVLFSLQYYIFDVGLRGSKLFL